MRSEKPYAKRQGMRVLFTLRVIGTNVGRAVLG